MVRARSCAAAALASAGVVLTLVGVALAVSGRSIEWTPLGISAQNAMRVVSEGLFALLAAAALRWHRCDRRTALAIAILLAAFHVSLAGASHPRRVGDGHEYIAMARQLSSGGRPAMSPDVLEHRRTEMASQPGYDAVSLRDPRLVGRDGRQDFVHFWLYPLVVAPGLALVSHLDLHWNVAFTAVNVALLAVLAYAALLELPVSLVLVLLAGPLIWWIDKAQVEAFNVALGGLAFVLLRRRPGPSLAPLGALSAQNPAFLLVLGPAAAWAIAAARGRERRAVSAWAAGAVMLSAVGPAYYAVRLGRPSPLADAASFHWPTVTAILTPLTDPFCGVVWHVPALVALVALALPAALRAWRDRDVALATWGAAAFLGVFALASNVNHGGTPGPSRYGLWLLPFTIPLLMRLDVLRGWRRSALPIVAIASMTHAMLAFHPRAPEQSTGANGWASWLTERWPAAYDPLPEVFAERYGATDGTAVLPLASTGCGKVLLAGDGRGAIAWPIPCLPATAPGACTREGALCYASRRAGGGYSFSVPPRQPGFGYQLVRDLTWRDARELAWMPVQPQWDRLERVPAFGRGSLVRGGRDLKRVRAFQFGRELLAFVEVRPGGSPVLELSGEAASDVWVMTRRSRRVHREPTGGRDAFIALPRRAREALVLVKPRG
jgi:hypothetical protein